MAHEELFFQMAVCEIKNRQQQPDLAALEAQSMLGGGIGLYSNSRDEFIKHGLEWLDSFSDHVAEARTEIVEQRMGMVDGQEENSAEGEVEHDYPPSHAEVREGEFRRLLSIVPEVDREHFAEILGMDWDERHEVEA